ncbi:MAG: tyrosine-protein phosphatase, partial [Clostridiales bacterium]|nr:tyrosine-protein phosphatase [Clostridiales bacterium]
MIDVRTPEEIGERPDKCFSVKYLCLPAFLMPAAGISREEGSDEKKYSGMAALYREIVREHAERLKKILVAIMEHDYASGAVLWHCSEGKERTGIVAALVLKALGASREDIMEDYLKTNIINIPQAEKIRDEVMKTHGPEAANQVYRSYIADEEYLSAALDEMG